MSLEEKIRREQKRHRIYLARAVRAQEAARPGHRWYWVHYKGRHICNVPAFNEDEAVKRAVEISGHLAEDLQVRLIETLGVWDGRRCVSTYVKPVARPTEDRSDRRLRIRLRIEP